MFWEFLSEQSGCDDNLLSSRERELLTNIVRQAKACDSSATSTVESILARAVAKRRCSERLQLPAAA
jgi:hypothetical protein